MPVPKQVIENGARSQLKRTAKTRRARRKIREEKELTSSTGKVRIAYLAIGVVRRSEMSGVQPI